MAINQKIRQPKRSHTLLWIFIGAALVRFSWAAVTPAQPVSDFIWYDQVARNVSGGLGFTRSGEAPTAYRPPAYPLFLAGIYRLSNGSLLAARLGNALLGTVTVLLTYILAGRYFSRRNATWSTALVAFTPSLILYSGLHASENLAVPALVAAILCIQLGLDQKSPAWLVLGGIFLGITSLTRGSFLLLPVAWLVWWIYRRIPLRRLVGMLSWIAAGIALPMLPWIFRNAATFGHFIPLSNNSGVNLLISFYPQSQGCFVSADQIPGMAALQAQNLDEYSFNRATRVLALEYFRDNPFRSMALAPMKIYYLYRDDVSGVIWTNRATNKPLPTSIYLGFLILTQVYYLAIMLLALAALVSHRQRPSCGS